MQASVAFWLYFMVLVFELSGVPSTKGLALQTGMAFRTRRPGIGVAKSTIEFPTLTETCDRYSLQRLWQSSSDGDNEENVADKTPSKFITAPESSVPQGYLSSDMSKMEDGKQNRVFAYIGLALIPCLFLVPFFLSRDFVPPKIDN